jgi:hypothetical protein
VPSPISLDSPGQGEADGEAVLGFHSRHPRKEGLARSSRLVFHLGDTLIAMAEFALDPGLVRRQAEGGAIEAVRFEREDGRLERLGIVEHSDGFTDCPGHSGIPSVSGHRERGGACGSDLGRDSEL